MIRCLRCGATAPEHATICPQCGHKLLRLQLAWHRCDHCGTLARATQRICAACGLPLRRRRLWPLVAGLVATVALLALAMMNWQRAERFVSRQLQALDAVALEAAAWPALATVTLAPPEASSDSPSLATTPTRAAQTGLRYQPPLLTAPDDGAVFAQDTEIWLRWAAVGELDEDDYYVLTLRYQRDGATIALSAWQKDTAWRVPAELWQQRDREHPDFTWDVIVMQQTGVDEDGAPAGQVVSAAGATRHFVWE